MRLCKYCNKPIAEKDIWNPDNDGNGYHHQCLVDMEFKARDKQIYDKGKMDVLDKIREAVKSIDTRYYSSVYGMDMTECADDFKHEILLIIDKYMEGSEE